MMKANSIVQMSSAQKLTQVAIFLPRERRYIAIDLVSRLEASVMLELGYKLPLVDLEPRYLRAFLKKRGLHFDPNVSLIKKGSYYDGRQGVIHVLSSDKLKAGDKNPYHYVEFWDFPTAGEKLSTNESFRNFTFHCPCGRVFQNSCRAPDEWRRFYHDNRTGYAMPSPSNTATMDRHVFVGIGAAGYEFELYDFGLFNPSSEQIEDARKLVKLQARGTRLANYIWEGTLEKTSLVEPFVTLVKEAYDKDLRRMIG